MCTKYEASLATHWSSCQQMNQASFTAQFLQVCRVDYSWMFVSSNSAESWCNTSTHSLEVSSMS